MIDGTPPSTRDHETSKLHSVTHGLSSVGFSGIEQDAIFSILAAVLNLGNVALSDQTAAGQPFDAASEKFIRKSAVIVFSHPVVFGHFSPAPVKTDHVVRIQ